MSDDHDLTKIGSLSMEFMDDLQDNLPDESEVVAVAIVCEVRFTCPHCSDVHTITPTRSTVASELHEEALFGRGSECAGVPWVVHVQVDEDESE